MSLGEKGIPDENIEQFTRIIAGKIQNYYNWKANRKEFEIWLAERSKKANKASKNKFYNLFILLHRFFGKKGVLFVLRKEQSQRPK